MRLPRMHLFEFNDSERTPAALRDSIVEILSRVLDESGAIAATVPIVERFLAESGRDALVDLCAGAGGPAEIVCREMLRAGKTPPHILETDLFPRPEAWSGPASRYPDHIDFVPESVDATRIPAEYAEGRARVIFNAFHHFTPELGTAILRGAVEDGAPILIIEGFERKPHRFAIPFGLPGLIAMMSNPLVSPRDRWAKALWTYATPAVWLAGGWDGVVSTLRVYDESELRGMVATFGQAYTWRYGTYEFKRGGRGTYFMGLPGAT